jgi:hypothetical protein
MTYGRRHGIKLEPKEFPPWLATLCEALSMDMKTLLGDVLEGYELATGFSDSPQTVVIHAVGQPGRPHRWLKEATLEIDRETRGVRRVTVTTGDRTQVRTIFSAHAYKSGGAMEAHFGLGSATSVDVEVTLLSGKTKTFTEIAADRIHTLSMEKP